MKEIEIPEGYEARIEGNKVVFEPKESEDERIRKGLIHHLKELREWKVGTMSPIKVREHYDAWIAYLEKQKEQEFTHHEVGESLEEAVTHQMEDDGDVDDFVRKGLDDVVLKYAKLGAEWQKDKVVKFDHDEDYREEDLQTRFAFYTYKDEDDILYLSNVFVEETSRNEGLGTKILAAAEKVAETLGIITIRLKVKQDSPANAWYRKLGYRYLIFEDGYDWLEKNLDYIKPKKSIKWSGDDELMIACLIAYLKGIGQDFISNDMVYWLKSLPERFNLPPKQEWSEEDSRILYNVIAYVGYAAGQRGVRDDEFKEANSWLKSLRPHWKPSKEQMEVLEYYMHTLICNNNKEILFGLYNDLKKL